MKSELLQKKQECNFGNMVNRTDFDRFCHPQFRRIFILVGQGYKPNVNVVLLEDLAAVLGICVAASAMSLSLYFQSPIPDAIGSLVVGGILGAVASFIIYSNTAALVGR